MRYDESSIADRRRLWQAAAFTLALLASPLLAQGGDEMPPVLLEGLKELAVWGGVALVLFLGSLFVAGRLLGLDVSPMDGVAAVLFGIVIAVVPVAVLTRTFGDSMGEQLGPLVIQGVTLAAFWQAIKVVFNTDYPRAGATLFLAATLSLSITSILLIGIY